MMGQIRKIWKCGKVVLCKVFIISIFIQIVFGRLTFLRENVNLPKKFDKNLFSTPPKTQIPVTKVFIF